tara:strand:- start:12195 stop:13109 length:915 start_codon:yes stop_codon:yes gene_type:complete
MTKVRSETHRRARTASDGGGGDDGDDAGGGRRDGGPEATTRTGGAVKTSVGGKRRRGRPLRSAKAVMPGAGVGERRDAATEACAEELQRSYAALGRELARRLVMYQMSYYRSMGQFPYYYGAPGPMARDYGAMDFRFQPQNRPATVPETTNARAEGDASQKQWPIVPQVSTAICPPKSDLVRSTPPGEFVKREAVNAGVQEASAAKSKAKAEAEARHDTGAARSSRDDERAAKKANEAAAKRVNEAKALLDPSAALDRSALARDSVQKDMRQRRSTAPSPESSNGAEQPGSEAIGSKGSKSAAA